jgi:uncharacterized YigZ family protein
MSATFVLTGAARLQQEVRKSRFLARAHPVDDVDAALAFVAGIGERDASHHCWAYRIGPLYRFNDDGEPAGTAGKPILQAIDGQKIDDVVVVVTRWFGGIKLGAGGLARAYGGCAAECLRLAAKRPKLALAVVRVHCDFASAAALHTWLRDHAATKRDERFLEDGVELELELPDVELPTLIEHVRDVTRGRGRVVLV